MFFVASRGHYADIGGTTPGSMPPNSQLLSEEGAVFRMVRVCKDGQFLEDECVGILNSPQQHGHPGSRNMADSLSDLRAQIAANNRGISLLRELCTAEGGMREWGML